MDHVLMGSRLKVLEEDGDWFRVQYREISVGWVHKSDVREMPCLKIFFVDVGQGDGVIVDTPDGIILVDGGPNSNFYKFFRYLYRNVIEEEGTVNVAAIVMSHPDWDHYNGLTQVLKDRKVRVGHIYHNGIIRYDDDDLPHDRDFDLGTLEERVVDGRQQHVLTETFSTLNEAIALCEGGHLMASFRNFWEAADDARNEGRLLGARAVSIRDGVLPRFDSAQGSATHIDVLAPVPMSAQGPIEYVGFPSTEDLNGGGRPSSSHTRNGHSVVLKLQFGDHTVMLGGDLNIPAQLHLMRHYGNDNPFRVDVAKACHHGSSDYHVDFLKRVAPQVNVFSSGDNKSFDHPMADAVGAAARHTRGDHPLFFSTELARAESSTGTHYGLINLRSNGTILAMAQMKEQHNKADVWDSFTVPRPGKFHEAIDGFDA